MLRYQWYPLTKQKIIEDKKHFKERSDKVIFRYDVVDWNYDEYRYGYFYNRKNRWHGFSREYYCSFWCGFEYFVAEFRLKREIYEEVMHYGKAERDTRLPPIFTDPPPASIVVVPISYDDPPF